MELIFDNKDILLTKDELYVVWKGLFKKLNIVCDVLIMHTIAITILGIGVFVHSFECYLLIGSLFLMVYMFVYKKMLLKKFRQRIENIPKSVFKDDNFIIGTKELNYADIEMLELGYGFARITIDKIKLVLIFKDKDVQEVDMLVAKLAQNAKVCKRV